MLGTRKEYKEESADSMPAISYDRARLMAIVKRFPVEAQENLIVRINDIEIQISIIRNNLSIKEVTEAVNKIENHANNIFDDNKKYHQTMANTLKTIILNIVEPAKAIVDREAEKNDSTDYVTVKNKNLTAELIEFRRQFLCAEQSFVTRQPPLHKLLIKHLLQLKKLLIDDSKKFSPRCYLVYFAPTRQNQSKEYWVLPFLSVLNVHLKIAGIQVVFGDEDRKPGDAFYSFLDKYKDSNDIIFIGTNSTKNYFKREFISSDENYVLDTLLQKQLRLQEESGIYPLLISGTPKTSFPDEFRYGSNVANAYGGYFSTLKLLTNFIFRKYIIGNEIAYDNIWKQFITNIQTLPENTVSVTKELNGDYHRSIELECIKREVFCLSDQAQKELLLEESQAKSVSTVSPSFVNPNLSLIPKTHNPLNVSFEVDEAAVGAPGGLNSPVRLVGGPGGPNFDLLAGLMKKPSQSGFNSSMRMDDQIEESDKAEEVPDVVESYRSPRPGGSSENNCSIS